MRNLDKSQQLTGFVQRENLPVVIQPLDVTQPDTIRHVLRMIAERYHRLDILVNNAGYGLGGFFEDTTPAEVRAQMETNFFGVLNVTRAALPLMRPAGTGKIINISSTAGLTAIPGMSCYHASKWALEGFSESLRQELLPFGIQVILVEPGPYPTKALKENAHFALGSRDPDSPYHSYAFKILEKWKKRTANLKSSPQEIAYLIGKISLQRNPKFRHVIGPTAKLRYYLHKFLPPRLNHWIIRKIIFK